VRWYSLGCPVLELPFGSCDSTSAESALAAQHNHRQAQASPDLPGYAAPALDIARVGSVPRGLPPRMSIRKGL